MTSDFSLAFQRMSLAESPHSQSAVPEQQVVWINYADCKWANVKVVNILEDLLVNSDSRRHIVIVGEGNFTFSIALAALRGSSWDGIISTARCHLDNLDSCPDPLLEDVSGHESGRGYPSQRTCLCGRFIEWSLDSIKLISIKYCMSNVLQSEAAQTLTDSGQLLADSKLKTRKLSNIETIIGLPSPPNGALMFGIDATNLPPYLSVKNKVVWFQCPWIPLYDRRTKSAIYDLILRFLQHMGDEQSENDYVLIGIVKLFPYVKEYLLGKMLGEDPVIAYDFLGADNTLIKKIIRFGYKHESSVNSKDIHEKLLPHHLTLVFKHR